MAAKAFAVVDRFEAVYTGGLVAPATAGGTLACMCGEDISLVDVATGRARSRVPCEGDVLTAFALSADGALLVTAGRSQALRAWAVDGTVPEAGRGWKAPHRAPVVLMALDSTGVLLATGSADKAVYVHDVERGYVTHALRAHGGAISALAFHPDAARLQLVSAAADGLVLVWALAGGDGAGEVVARLDSHVSAPSCLAFSADGRTLVSGGRDKVAVVWDLATKRALRTIPTREPLEGVACVVAAPAAGAPPSLLALTAGEGGQLRAWDTATGKCVAGGSGGGALGAHPAILGLALLPAAKPAGGAKAGGAAAAARDAAAASVCSWDVEQNITFTPLAQLLARLPGQPDDGAKPARRPAEPARDAWARAASVRVLPGSLDEISDLRYLGASAAPMPAAAVAIAAAAAPVVAAGMEAVAGAVVGGGAPSACPLVVVASNSSQLRLLDLGTRACALLSGHSDLVLALDVSADGRWIGSASKDATVRLWCAATGAPAAVGTGHTEPVAALAFCPRTGDLFSGSKDKTIKRWDAGKLMRAWAAAASKGEPEPMALRARASCVAHAKEVNGLALAPTGAQLVSASQDKSLRVWSVSAEGEIALQGPLSGHRRAVWSVAVSQFERVAASASGDCTVRVWSLSDLTCLRTLEGHAGPVLRVAWLNAGTQIASSSSDGLVKIWTAKVKTRRARAPLARADGALAGGARWAPSRWGLVRSGHMHAAARSRRLYARLLSALTPCEPFSRAPRPLPLPPCRAQPLTNAPRTHSACRRASAR
jgi:U3 small nucleolar RNA-associated protein 13